MPGRRRLRGDLAPPVCSSGLWRKSPAVTGTSGPCAGRPGRLPSGSRCGGTRAAAGTAGARTLIIPNSFRTYGRVCYLVVGHLGRVAGCADAQIIPIYTLNAASTAAAPPGTTWGGGPQPQSSWGCGPPPQNGSPHTTSRTRGTRKVDLMTDAAYKANSLNAEKSFRDNGVEVACGEGAARCRVTPAPEGAPEARVPARRGRRPGAASVVATTRCAAEPFFVIKGCEQVVVAVVVDDARSLLGIGEGLGRDRVDRRRGRRGLPGGGVEADQLDPAPVRAEDPPLRTVSAGDQRRVDRVVVVRRGGTEARPCVIKVP